MPLPTDSWSEFDWEETFRSDDARINMYMRELPRYVDLPGEDDLILKKITSDPEFAGICDARYTDRMAPYFTDREEVEACDDGSWQTRDGAESFMLFSKLARLWAQDFARTPSGSSMAFMRIECIYGQLMLHGSDLMDLREQDAGAAPLKIAIAKRMLSSVNFLCGEFNSIREKELSLEESCDYHFRALMEIREKIIAFISKIRKEAASAASRGKKKE